MGKTEYKIIFECDNQLKINMEAIKYDKHGNEIFKINMKDVDSPGDNFDEIFNTIDNVIEKMKGHKK